MSLVELVSGGTAVGSGAAAVDKAQGAGTARAEQRDPEGVPAVSFVAGSETSTQPGVGDETGRQERSRMAAGVAVGTDHELRG